MKGSTARVLLFQSNRRDAPMSERIESVIINQKKSRTKDLIVGVLLMTGVLFTLAGVI